MIPLPMPGLVGTVGSQMKTLRSNFPLVLTLLVLAAILVSGCAGTPEENQDRCDKARAVYTTYLAVSAVRNPSADEVAAAKAAGAILTAWCGWETPASGAATRGKTTDKNGVPILIPPQ